jgi:cellulose synthase/poly-beta-1,6-N-acetylglucosamine synthase-like glycosyltransferase
MIAKEKNKFTALFVVGITLTAVFGVWWFWPSHIPNNFTGASHVADYIFFLLLSYIVWHEIMLEVFSWYVAAYIKDPEIPVTPPPNLRVAYLTAFVPGVESYDVLEKTLMAMTQVDYPHDTWLLDEGDDRVAKEICKKHGVNHYSRKGQENFNTNSGKFTKKTKGGNYNSWLHYYDHDYDIVAQHDVDFVPKQNFLMRTLGYFRDPSVAFVGTPQMYGNINGSWLARGAAEQTYGFYGPLQKGLHGHNMTLLIGANHVMRMDAYRDIDGYTAHITEDMLTGMKIYTREKKWKSVYVPEVLLIGEGPETWTSYFNQQMRWAYGCMDIAFRHAPDLLPKMKPRHIFNYLILLQFYFSGLTQFVGVTLLTIYFIFGFSPANMSLWPLFVLYLPLMIYQVLFQSWLQRFNIQPKIENGLMLRGKLLSLAAWPVFFLAFISVVQGKHLSYVVTPKGDAQPSSYKPSLFMPHFILGSITLLGMIIGVALRHSSGPMIFWASLNTIVMYYFFFKEAVPATFAYLSRQQYLAKGTLL